MTFTNRLMALRKLAVVTNSQYLDMLTVKNILIKKCL